MWHRSGMTQSRLLPTVLLAASSWLLISLFGSQQILGVARHRQRAYGNTGESNKMLKAF